MAEFQITVECEYASEDILSDVDAMRQYNLMIKQIGKRLDEFRSEVQDSVVSKHPTTDKRMWVINIVFTTTNANPEIIE